MVLICVYCFSFFFFLFLFVYFLYYSKTKTKTLMRKSAVSEKLSLYRQIHVTIFLVTQVYCVYYKTFNILHFKILIYKKIVNTRKDTSV